MVSRTAKSGKCRSSDLRRKVCAAARVAVRHIAKRSSELNAKWMPALGMAAGALWLSVCLVATNAAEPGHSSHGDVDKLLVEARAAIEAGNLDRASALVERAEAAQPKYSLFHLGPTPALVRRELTQAQKAAGWAIAGRLNARPHSPPSRAPLRTGAHASSRPIRLPNG